EDNPVYYVQYAHARICSVLRNAQEQLGLDEAALQSTLLNADLNLLDSERAVALMQRLAAFPDLLASACQDLAPHSVAFYL
ncbi:DALR anticodon-binding domain-containing protein, partial [Acinetobacter baumannii]